MSIGEGATVDMRSGSEYRKVGRRLYLRGRCVGWHGSFGGDWVRGVILRWVSGPREIEHYKDIRAPLSYFIFY